MHSELAGYLTAMVTIWPDSGGGHPWFELAWLARHERIVVNIPIRGGLVEKRDRPV